MDRPQPGLEQQPETMDPTQELGWQDRHPGLYKGLSGIALAGSGAALFIQQSPLNEVVRSNLAFDAFQNSGGSIVKAVGSVLASTAVIEGVTTGLITLGLHFKRELFERYINKLPKVRSQAGLHEDLDSNDKGAKKNKKFGDYLINAAITFGVGPGFVVLRKNVQEENRPLKDDIKTGAGYVGLGMGLSAAVGWVVFGGGDLAGKANIGPYHSDKVSLGAFKAENIGMDKVNLGPPVEFLADKLADWKTYAGGAALIYGTKYAAKGAKAAFRKVKGLFAKNESADLASEEPEVL